MKHLLLLLFFSGSLDGFSQDRTASMCWQHKIVSFDKCAKCIEAAKLDTLPSAILLSHKPPSFGHAVNGYCVCQGGVCTGNHLRYWHKRWIRVGPEYVVWGCRVITPKK
jgi:hypothetical protein